MSKNIEKLLIAVGCAFVAVLLACGVKFLVTKPAAPVINVTVPAQQAGIGAGGGDGTHLKKLTVTETLDVSSTARVTGAVTLEGALTVSGAVTFSSNTRAKSLVSTGSVLTKSASSTITAAEFCANNVWIVTPVSTTPTITLPNANLLAADCLSAVGDIRSIMIFNYSLTTNTLFAAGTSSTINWSISTSSVNPSNSVELIAFRTSTTGGYEVQMNVAAN